MGLLYALNVAGAIAGSLTAGFVLLPWLGAVNTLIAMAGLDRGLRTFLDVLTQRLAEIGRFGDTSFVVAADQTLVAVRCNQFALLCGRLVGFSRAARIWRVNVSTPCVNHCPTNFA